LAIEWLDTGPVSFEEILASHRVIISVDAADHHRSAFRAAPEQFGPKIASLIEEGLQTTAVDYAAALRHQARARSELAPLFANSRVLLIPSTTTPAPGLDTTGDPTFNSLWSFSGLPSITVPCGLSRDGLPCGLQLIGAAGSERSLLAAASSCEASLGFRQRPSILA
jgi:aspartyl-tRNA(Asn)/glutamyl-tRNA(Gln) amidotransferase subunit A